MASMAPPPSPSKRPGLLRSVVTSIDRPVDRDTHAQRWHRAPAGPRSPHSPNVSGGAASGGSSSESSRVRSLVQGWEQASLGTRSKPYEALPPPPISPYRTNFATRDASSDRPALRVNSNQRDLAPGEATSPTRGTSPTVPASFFQKQAFVRTASDAPVKFDPQQQRNRVTQPGKENYQPPSSTAAAPRLPQINMAPLMSASTMSARTDLTTNSDDGDSLEWIDSRLESGHELGTSARSAGNSDSLRYLFAHRRQWAAGPACSGIGSDSVPVSPAFFLAGVDLASFATRDESPPCLVLHRGPPSSSKRSDTFAR
jgi:hypothetical protein